MTDILYSVIVVNFNGRDHLPGCLKSLKEQTLPAHLFEVLIVDNGSTDGSTDWLREHHPSLRVYRSDTNLGFAGANNLGMSYARASWLVLLNHDTLADPFWLEEMHRVRMETGGAVVAKLVLAEDPTRLNSTGLYLLRDGRGADRGFLQPDHGQYERTEATFMGCAAAIMLPRPPGPKLLPAEFFLYYEDLFWGWANQLAGRGVTYAPRALVRHAVGAKVREATPFFQHLTLRNRWFLCAYHQEWFLVGYVTLVILAKGCLTGDIRMSLATWTALPAAMLMTLRRFLREAFL
jgi:GT2 family glycosyltransferase